MTHRTTGIDCHYDKFHGFAVRKDPNGLLLCDECATEYDNMADAIEKFKTQTTGTRKP